MKKEEKLVGLIAVIPILFGCFFGKTPAGYILVGYGLFVIGVIDIIVWGREIKEWRRKIFQSW